MGAQAAPRGPELEGLLDEVDRAPVESTVTVDALVVGGAEDELAPWVQHVDALADFEAVDVGKVQVQDRDIDEASVAWCGCGATPSEASAPYKNSTFSRAPIRCSNCEASTGLDRNSFAPMAVART